MKMVALGLLACCSVSLTSVGLASYADDRAEIENLSNRYMVAVDAGDWGARECTCTALVANKTTIHKTETRIYRRIDIPP